MNEIKKIPDSPVCYIKGVGEKRAKLLEKLGITTALQLAEHYPRGYIDFNETTAISDLVNDGENHVVKAIVTKKFPAYYGRINIFKVLVSDGTGDMLITFFNSDYSFTRLKLDNEYCFYGKMAGDFLRKEMNSPVFIDSQDPNKLMPRYSLTTGISQGIMSNCIKNVLRDFTFPEHLTDTLMDKYNLISYDNALRWIHFPENKEQYDKAKYRLTFEELFLLQLGLKSMKNRKKRLAGAPMESKSIDEYYSSLPFTLTGAQIRAISECCDDMQKSVPMNRLLQGDVGSGKTAVAAGAAYFAYLNGYQSTLMAPTEILAKQHYDTLYKFLAPLGVTIALLTGSQTPAQKKQIRQLIADGQIDIAVGTQALIQKSTRFSSLGLVITDEQHRFGVAQRAKLLGKGNNPHLLVMSATPIPRTLGLIIFGDLDISIIDELPPSRKPVKTVLRTSAMRGGVYDFIRSEVKHGRQAYIVCPLVEEGELDDVASAEEYAADLMLREFPDIAVGIVHGQMKSDEKDEVMRKFVENEYSVLVATTVIEVGVDVPNATVIVIENAERFGLSQLHQLRGRVGRGSSQSYCILISDKGSKTTRERLEVMCSTNNGFVIADEDLKMRGPGDFFGHRQHGLPQMSIADFADTKSLELSQKIADCIMDCYGDIRNDEIRLLKAEVDRLFERGGQNALN